MSTETKTSIPEYSPTIGQYWPGQGGIYVGDFRGDDGRIYGLIAADCGAAQDVGIAQWVQKGRHELSPWDGLTNTLSLGDKHPAAKLAAGYTAEGHQDFYLPACRELQLAVANIPYQFGNESWYWSSTPHAESYAWAVDFVYGRTVVLDRSTEARVRPFRRFRY